MSLPETTPNSAASTVRFDRLDLAALIFTMVFPTFVTLVYFQWLQNSESSLQQVAFGMGKIVQFGFPIAWVWFRHRDKLFRKSKFKTFSRNDIFAGIGFGLAVVVAMFVIYFFVLAPTETGTKLNEMVKAKVSQMGLDSFWKYLAVGVFYAICHSFLEEYYWRWFVFEFLQKFVSTAWANFLSSVGFMAHHVVLLGFFFNWSIWTYVLSASIAVGGSFWAWQFKTTDKLRVPWISHAIVDAGIFSLGYFLVKALFS
ncbi:MAG: CPBP family intramembrane glutamic endopeptidase [Mariniblastus sp.]